MNSFRKFAAPAALVFGLLLSTGASFAAPVFSMAAPGSAMNLDDFKAQMGAFNPSEVTAFVDAKTVSVLKYADAWDVSSSTKAENILSDFASQIALRRDALKANPAAMKLLEANHINVDDVIEIVSDGSGAVSIYVS